MKNKKILMTGASGFIASHLTRRLYNEGANITILTLYNDKINNIRLTDIWDNINVIEADIRNIDSLRPLRKLDFDIVYHFAAYNHVGDSFRHVSHSFDVNGKGTANLLDACERAKKFIYISSSEIYGYQKEVPFKEDFNPRPLSPYAIGKYAGELYCRMKLHINNAPIVILRPFNAFGPYQSTRAIIPETIINCLLGKEVKTTKGKQTREYNFISNLVDAFVLAGKNKNAVGKIINIGSGKDISIKDLVSLTHKLTASKSKLKIGSLKYRPTETWKMVSDNSRAKEILCWEPRISFEEGLKLTIDWYKHYTNLYHNKHSSLSRLSNLRIPPD